MTDAPGTAPPPRPGPAKGPAAFRTISEASSEVGVPQHVLRFWETRFAFISPTKRAGGRRFYRPQDLDVLRGVRVLLQDEGYTIKGVQKLHKDQGLKRLLAAAGVGEAAAVLLAREVEAELEPDLPPASAEDEEEDGPEPADLFGEASTAAPPPPPQVAPAPTRAPGVLDAAARSRLGDVLGDLEATKAQIDALLRGG